MRLRLSRPQSTTNVSQSDSEQVYVQLGTINRSDSEGTASPGRALCSAWDDLSSLDEVVEGRAGD